MDAHKTAELIDEAISLAGCVGGSYFCHFLLINQKLTDPLHIRFAKIGRVLALVGAAISCLLIAATYFGWQ